MLNHGESIDLRSCPRFISIFTGGMFTIPSHCFTQMNILTTPKKGCNSQFMVYHHFSSLFTHELLIFSIHPSISCYMLLSLYIHYLSGIHHYSHHSIHSFTHTNHIFSHLFTLLHGFPSFPIGFW